MFLFQISSYDNPALESETESLLLQRLEAHSRKTMPAVWWATDALNAAAPTSQQQKNRKKRCRVYGIILLALGLFVLVPGIVPPVNPSLAGTGIITIVFSLFEFCLAREKKPPHLPASCQREAKQLLAGRRAVDWSAAQAQVIFDETGMTISSKESREPVPYNQITGIFETASLWLMVYGDEKALLLQKKDLTAGEPDNFSPFIRQAIETH